MVAARVRGRCSREATPCPQPPRAAHISQYTAATDAECSERRGRSRTCAPHVRLRARSARPAIMAITDAPGAKRGLFRTVTSCMYHTMSPHAKTCGAKQGQGLVPGEERGLTTPQDRTRSLLVSLLRFTASPSRFTADEATDRTNLY